MRQVGEPTVEEILESIKKVIARDNRVGTEVDRRASRPGSVDEADADPAPARHEADRMGDVLDLADSADIAEYADELDEGDEDAAPEAPLINARAQADMRESLAMLAMMAEPGAQPQIVRSGETSLEGMVRDLLRPALADWLDKNLPPLVERMVAAEITRIVGKRG